MAAIFNACIACLAANGPEGVSLSDVAKQAGVNRSTAYAYFGSRESLIAETTSWVSGQLFTAVFGPAEAGRPPEADMLGLTGRLANFAMENPALCRVWLLQVLALPDPSKDVFWRKYHGESRRFTKTELAQPGMDAEVFTVMQLAGAFLWPMTMLARGMDAKSLSRQTRRYVRECVRQAMYGTVRPERFPDLAARLPGSARKQTRGNDG